MLLVCLKIKIKATNLLHDCFLYQQIEYGVWVNYLISLKKIYSYVSRYVVNNCHHFDYLWYKNFFKDYVRRFKKT